MKNILILICLLGSLGLHGQKKLMIDPGHGYTNGSPSQGNPDGRTSTEILTNFAVAQKLYNRLQNCSAITGYQTTSGNKFISLSQRALKSNNYYVDRFISIHCNASGPVCCGNGTETHYYKNTNSTGIAWSQKLQNRMKQQGQWYDRGLWASNHYVTRATNAYACLSEIGFVDNPSNASKLWSNWWRDKFAYAYELAMRDQYGLTCSGGGGGGGGGSAKPGSFNAYAQARCYNGNNYSRITWTGSANAAGYRIYRNGVLYTTLSASARSYNNWWVGSGGTHWKYQVVAFNSAGNTWNANGKRWATALYCSGSNKSGDSGMPDDFMQDAGASTYFRIAPNPVINNLDVYGSNLSSDDLIMTVYDMTGRVVVSTFRVPVESGEASTSLDVSGLSSGVYYLRCRADGEVFDQKFTKQ